MPSPMSLPEPLCSFAAAVVGEPAVRVEDLTTAGSDAAVWRLRGPTRGAVLKLHRNHDKHTRERNAYREWLPGLPRVARLLGVRDEEPRALLLEEVPGEASAGTASAAAPFLHREAGTWLAALHALPHTGDDTMDLAEAYGRRARAWFRRAAPLLDASRMDEAEARVGEMLPFLRGRARVPCHRDFTPRNWLVREGRLAAVIDFEHARPDLAQADLARLAVQVWPRRPELREAFLDGYGVPPPWLEGLVVLEAVATLAWAAEHDDPTFAAAARRVLEAKEG